MRPGCALVELWDAYYERIGRPAVLTLPKEDRPLVARVLRVAPDIEDVAPGDAVVIAHEPGKQIARARFGTKFAPKHDVFFIGRSAEGGDRQSGYGLHVRSYIEDYWDHIWVKMNEAGNLVPLGRNVLLKREPIRRQTKTGLWLAPEAWERDSVATVVAVGSLVNADGDDPIEVGERYVFLNLGIRRMNASLLEPGSANYKFSDYVVCDKNALVAKVID